MSLFQDTGFDLLPKIPEIPVLPELQVKVPLNNISAPLAVAGTPAGPSGNPGPGNGNNVVGIILVILIIASALGVIYMASKYAKAAVTDREPNA